MTRSDSPDRLPRDFATLNRVGGRLCLDFANTVNGRGLAQPDDWLGTYEDLARWAKHADLLDDRAARRLTSAGRRRPAEAARVLRRAIRLREALYRAFLVAAGGGRPAPSDLAVLNREWGEALTHLELTTGEPCCAVECRGDDDALDRILWSVARSATELLTSEDVARVKACDDHECAWLFLDESRNQSRRWCDMRDCGNRAKARRHYARRRRRRRPRRSSRVAEPAR